MTSIEHVLLETSDPAAAADFYETAFGVSDRVRVREAAAEPTTGFRGYTLSLIVAQPADVDALVDAALGSGATSLKPVSKSLWGYGGSVEAPDGAVWTIATSKKKDHGPPSKDVEQVVLLLGPQDVAASKRFYVDRGLTVAKSFGRKYVEFESPAGGVRLGLNARRALAKNAGVTADGSGGHRLAIVSGLGPFTDPDGFAWEPPTPSSAAG